LGLLRAAGEDMLTRAGSGLCARGVVAGSREHGARVGSVKMGEGSFAFLEKCRIWLHLVASQFEGSEVGLICTGAHLAVGGNVTRRHGDTERDVGGKVGFVLRRRE